MKKRYKVTTRSCLPAMLCCDTAAVVDGDDQRLCGRGRVTLNGSIDSSARCVVDVDFTSLI